MVELGREPGFDKKGAWPMCLWRIDLDNSLFSKLLRKIVAKWTDILWVLNISDGAKIDSGWNMY